MTPFPELQPRIQATATRGGIDIRTIAGAKPTPRPRWRLLLLAAFVPLLAACAAVASPQGWAGPTMEDDTLYASTERGKMAALDAENPDDLVARWVFPDNDRINDERVDLQAIYAAPVVDEDKVYLGGYDGYVYALDKEDGSMLWRFGTNDPIIGSLALENGRLYAGSSDGRLYVLDPETGAELMDPFEPGDEIWASPVIENGVLYVATVGGDVFALDPETLDPVWEEPFGSAGGLVMDPLLTEDGVLLVGGMGKRLYAVNAETGEEIWSFRGGNWFWGQPLVLDGVVYAPNLDHKVYALSLADGTEVWPEAFETEAPVRSSPLMVNDRIVVIDRSGNVFAVDPAEGTMVWGNPALLDETVLSDPILLGDSILVVAQGGTIFTVDPSAGATRIVRVFQ